MIQSIVGHNRKQMKREEKKDETYELNLVEEDVPTIPLIPVSTSSGQFETTPCEAKSPKSFLGLLHVRHKLKEKIGVTMHSPL